MPTPPQKPNFPLGNQESEKMKPLESILPLPESILPKSEPQPDIHSIGIPTSSTFKLGSAPVIDLKQMFGLPDTVVVEEKPTPLNQAEVVKDVVDEVPSEPLPGRIGEGEG